MRKHTVVVRASSYSESVDGVHRNLIPDETRKMSQRVGEYKRVLPTLRQEQRVLQQSRSDLQVKVEPSFLEKIKPSFIA